MCAAAGRVQRVRIRVRIRVRVRVRESVRVRIRVSIRKGRGQQENTSNLSLFAVIRFNGANDHVYSVRGND